VRSELTEAERAQGKAEIEARPPESRPIVVALLQAALARAGLWRGRAASLGPSLAAAETHLQKKREDAARHRLRIRGLERAMARRAALIRMERRRHETRRVDDLVRSARQVSETDHA
jgi:hypothetical protein